MEDLDLVDNLNGLPATVNELLKDNTITIVSKLSSLRINSFFGIEDLVFKNKREGCEVFYFNFRALNRILQAASAIGCYLLYAGEGTFILTNGQEYSAM